MTYSLRILPEAADDIKEITLWYKSISPELANRFVIQLYDGFNKIVANPNAWLIVASYVRRYSIPHFPYLIIISFAG